MAHYKKPRKMSMVRFTKSAWECIKKWRAKYPSSYDDFEQDDRFIYMGDIVNMPEHCVILRIVHKTKKGKVVRDNKTFSCYHTSDFEEVPRDEV